MIQFSKWKRGIALSSSLNPGAFIFWRFYEWTLFDAVQMGDHTRGRDEWPWRLAEGNTRASLESSELRLLAEAVEDGALLTLSVTNQSDHDWPPIAAIVPCLGAEYADDAAPPNPAFFDDDHERTYFLGTDGLELLKAREIHYNASLKEAVVRRSPRSDGVFEAISHKWPTSERDASAGFMARESSDGRLVTGIAWEDFLSAQGHNPRKCMHLSVRVGPLERGRSKTIRGKIYLFAGTARDCLAHFERDFGIA